MDLSPRGAGRLIDDAFALYGANFRSLLKALAVVVFPVLLLYGVVQVFYYRGWIEMTMNIILSRGAPTVDPSVFANDPALAIASAGSIALGLAYAGVKLFFDGSVYASVPEMVTGTRPAWKDMLARGRGVFLLLVLVQLLMFVALYGAAMVGYLLVIITLGLGLLVFVPGLAYLSVALSLAGPAAVIERCSVTDALRRSFALVRGDFWRVFWMLTAVWFITLQVESAIISPLAIREVFVALQQPDAVYHPASATWKIIEGAAQAAAVALVLPISDLALVSVYLDMRSRREGMDLLIRAQDLTPEATGDPETA